LNFLKHFVCHFVRITADQHLIENDLIQYRKSFESADFISKLHGSLMHRRDHLINAGFTKVSLLCLLNACLTSDSDLSR